MDTAAENELLCARLLEWSPLPLLHDRAQQQWYTRTSATPAFTPTFDCWNGTGLLLDALVRHGQNPDVCHWDGKWHALIDCKCCDDDWPEAFDSPHVAVRAAALHFLRTRTYGMTAQ